MLRDTLKQEIDRLNESQLRKIAEYITWVKLPKPDVAIRIPFWQTATPAERVQDLRTWVAGLPKTEVSLSNAACDRGSIYE